MNERPLTDPGSKKRGRDGPSTQVRYSQEKANADVRQKRARRQYEASAERDKQHANFYMPSLPSILPSLPRQANCESSVQTRHGVMMASTSTADPVEGHDHRPQTDDLEISHLLPPPTPAATNSRRDFPGRRSIFLGSALATSGWCYRGFSSRSEGPDQQLHWKLFDMTSGMKQSRSSFGMTTRTFREM
jgi:hypothetical protein